MNVGSDVRGKAPRAVGRSDSFTELTRTQGTRIL